jgi:hypothetical protein
VKKALRTLLPRPPPQTINTHSSVPAPVARSQIAPQDLSSIQITVGLLAPDGSDQEWSVAGGKVPPAFVAEGNNNNGTSQRESS